jgi:AmmeMemoRadiSam system radical SAM enzyme/AmmeMemoRadiSam system protein B
MTQFYKEGKSEDKKICTLCQHYCNISVGKTGICGVNKNTGDKIECLVYGYPAVINADPVEKKPLYHFLPQTKTLSLGTVGCNFKCSFCQNHGISQEQTINKEKYYSPEDIVKMAFARGCDSISYTYNEPTIFYPYIKDIATLAKANGLKNVFVSNGFESDEVLNDMAGLIDAANIDYKSNDAKYYKKELGGNLEKLQRNLKRFKELGIWIEVTTLIIPDLNDSNEELEAMAQFMVRELGEETPWHLSAFHPDYKMLDRGRTPKETLERAKSIGDRAGLKYVYMGNAGLDNTTRCRKCDEVVLNRVTYQTKIDNRKLGVLCPKCDSKLDGVFHTRRDDSFAGSFYSNSCNEIKKQLSHFESLLQNSNFTAPKHINTKAIIVPHAGYIYSGFTANVAYHIARSKKPRRVIVIGPSHKFGFEGASVTLHDKYQTPCGDINIDTRYAHHLKNKFEFVNFYEGVHVEHSTETQALFVKGNFPQSSIVEIVYGKIEHTDLAKVVEEVLKDENNFLVISTDLSHFYTQEKANKLDSVCLEAIDKLDLNIWNQGCEACGRVGVKALIEVANQKKWSSQVLDYRTSFDITKDDTRVVGYTSAIVGEKID